MSKPQIERGFNYDNARNQQEIRRTLQAGVLLADERPLDSGRLRNRPENERGNPAVERGIKGVDKMKKIYTEKGLDELIRIYGFEHKKVIEYAKRLDKQEKI